MARGSKGGITALPAESSRIELRFVDLLSDQLYQLQQLKTLVLDALIRTRFSRVK